MTQVQQSAAEEFRKKLSERAITLSPSRTMADHERWLAYIELALELHRKTFRRTVDGVEDERLQALLVRAQALLETPVTVERR